MWLVGPPAHCGRWGQENVLWRAPLSPFKRHTSHTAALYGEERGTGRPEDGAPVVWCEAGHTAQKSQGGTAEWGVGRDCVSWDVGGAVWEWYRGYS